MLLSHFIFRVERFKKQPSNVYLWDTSVEAFQLARWRSAE